MTQVIHNCACTTVYIQCNGLSIYSTVFESTYGCYPTKWQFGRKLFLFFFLIWHANDCFFFFYHEIVNISPLLFQIRECGNNLRQHTVLLPMWDIWQSALGSEFSAVNLRLHLHHKAHVNTRCECTQNPYPRSQNFQLQLILTVPTCYVHQDHTN